MVFLNISTCVYKDIKKKVKYLPIGYIYKVWDKARVTERVYLASGVVCKLKPLSRRANIVITPQTSSQLLEMLMHTQMLVHKTQIQTLLELHKHYHNC